MTHPTPIRLRPFVAADLPQTVAINNAAYPEYLDTLDEARHWDESWDEARYTRVRYVAEDDGGEIVGHGRIAHMKEQFHPRKFELQIAVHPDHRRRGVGGALYARLEDELRARDAINARAEAKESMPEGVTFLTKRGFAEADRSWESRLAIARFDEAPFAGVEARIAAAGVTITTLDVERARDPAALDAAHALWLACMRDVPEIDPFTEVPLDAFRTSEVEGPHALPDGYFLAVVGGRYVGQSSLARSDADPTFYYQYLTGVLPEYRGGGIALALKLRTVRYARERGVAEIRTWNNTRNAPMLRINDALGFAKQPVWLTMVKSFAPATPNPGPPPAPAWRPSS